MKFRNFLTQSILMLVVGFLSASVFAGGTKIGNGGGGIVAQDNYLTVPESGLRIEGQSLIEVPEVDHLASQLQKMKMSSVIFNRLSPHLFPSMIRSYYQIPQIDPAALAELKKVYSKSLNIPEAQVVIFAITDASQEKTFLLPDFYKLNAVQKDQILFHEWLWVLNPDATYEDVMYGEKLFYQFLQDPESSYFDLVLEMTRFVKDPKFILAPVLNRSMKTVNSANQLFDETFWTCVNSPGAQDSTEMTQQCLSDWLSRTAFVSNKNILQKMVVQFANLGGNLEFGWSRYSNLASSKYQMSFIDGPVPQISIVREGSQLTLGSLYFR